MSRQIWPMILGLSVFALSAVGIAAFMMASGQLDPVLSAGAVLLLAAGQAVVIITTSFRMIQLEDRLARQQAGLRALTETSENLATRLDRVEQVPKAPVSNRLDEITADIRALRDSITIYSQPPEQAPPPPALAPALPPASSIAEEPAPPPPEPRLANERLELLLEPVIELATGTTAHYRAILDLTDDQGRVVHHHELLQKVDIGGMRPALDAHMVKQVAPVLRRLRIKNPGLRAFVPIGSATLGSSEEMARISALIERESDVAAGMVFEFHHRDLGTLDDTGIDSLAGLGRLGATLALSDAQVSSLDLAALRQLGVRYLSFGPHAADAGFGPSPAWREFVQYARAMQFQIVISDIETAQQASAAAQVGRFGYGPYFAPPRKVRADAGTASVPRHASAA